MSSPTTVRLPVPHMCSTFTKYSKHLVAIEVVTRKKAA